MTAIAVPPEIGALLQAGKLEQSCPACGRWEAAHFYCSWCMRPMGPADWYPNGDLVQRNGHLPSVAPANPPSEFLRERDWPERWGTYPRQKPASERQTPVKRRPRVIHAKPSSRPFGKGKTPGSVTSGPTRLSAAPDGPHTPESVT